MEYTVQRHEILAAPIPQYLHTPATLIFSLTWQSASLGNPALLAQLRALLISDVSLQLLFLLFTLPVQGRKFAVNASGGHLSPDIMLDRAMPAVSY
jgi:hypothetical protein